MNGRMYLTEQLQAICIFSSASGAANLFYTIDSTKWHFYSKRRVLQCKLCHDYVCMKAEKKG